MEMEREAPTLDTLPSDMIITIALYLPLKSFPHLLSACRPLRAVLDPSEYIWQTLAHCLWARLVYVPEYYRLLLGGPASLSAYVASERDRLAAELSVKQLRVELAKLGVPPTQIASCYEKKDMAELGAAAMLKRLKGVRDLLRVPDAPGHFAAAKAALRLSVLDLRRTDISEVELVRQAFNVRVRHDGPFDKLMAVDPWWLGKGCTQMRFREEGQKLDLICPEDPVTGEEMNMFE